MLVPDAGQAVLRVVGQQEFDRHLAGLAGQRGVGVHLHSFRHRLGAGGLKRPAALDFHHADAAIGPHIQVRMVTERRYLDPDQLGRFYDIGALWRRYFLAVDRQFHCFHEFTSFPWESGRLGRYGRRFPHPANAGRTTFLLHVRLDLRPEMLEAGEKRDRRGLA